MASAVGFSGETHPDAGRHVVTIRQIGRSADFLLKPFACGRVASVFRTCFYVQVGSRYACIGTQKLYASPLNVVTTVPDTTNWLACGIHPNDALFVLPDSVRIGQSLTFQTADAEAWQPAEVPAQWTAESLRRGLSVCLDSSIGRIPSEGLGFAILQEPGKSVQSGSCALPSAPLNALRVWLQQALRHGADVGSTPAPVTQLVGLGPGLTPSGDDFIGGTLVALRALGRPELVDQVWAVARPVAEAAGGPISFAHLDAAAEGQMAAGIHSAMNAIVMGDPGRIRGALNEIDGIGHTSGWDALAGIVMVFQVWLMVCGDQSET